MGACSASKLNLNNMTLANIHAHILKQIIENGFAPSIKEMAGTFQTAPENIKALLLALADYHGVVLHPHNDEVWVIHPFSTAPTSFAVKTNTGKIWWGNCAWCSFGVAALVKEDVTISTSFGAHGDPITLSIIEGELQEPDYVVHFPIPMKEAWDNVIYTCSNMLLFESEADVDHWVGRHRIRKGDVQTTGKVWTFAKEWYGNHLNEHWGKWTINQAIDIFKRHQLTHPVWDLSSEKGRF